MGRCASFIEGLPDGLRSFPEARGRMSLFRSLYELTDEEHLDDRLREAMARTTDDDWQPEVVCAAIVSAFADHCGDERDFLAQMLEHNLEIYRRPLFRGLMFVMSPTLVLMGAAKRWGAFHEGSSLEVAQWSRTDTHQCAQLHLRHPPGMFLPLHHRAYGEAFRAAALATRLKEAEIECISSADSAEFRVRYPR